MKGSMEVLTRLSLEMFTDGFYGDFTKGFYGDDRDMLELPGELPKQFS